MPHNIAYYISAHGFGHAARQQAVINEIVKHGIQVHVRSAAPQKFFRNATTYHHQAYDVGMKQHDALHFDVDASLKAMADFIAAQDALIEDELAFIQANDIQLIVSDMPPVAIEIAAQANIPSVAITHFTWDWVYDYYTDDYPQYHHVVDAIRESYSKTTLALQIQHPLPHKFDMFPQVEPIPMLHNPTTQTPQAIRAMLDVPEGYKLGLVSMGGHTWSGINIEALKAYQDWIFCITPSTWEQVKDTPERFRLIPQEASDYQNFIAAADVLVGKAGGSTISEIIAHRTPMIYTTQNNWHEAALLDETLKQVAASHYIPVEDFMAGAWLNELEPFMTIPHQWAEIPINGAEIAARKIIAMLN